MFETDLYEILGVSKNATQKEIKAAFQKKAFQYHPDKNQNDPKSVSRFQEINEAYNILRNESKRSDYDKFGFSIFDEESTVKNSFFSNLFGTFGSAVSAPFFSKKVEKTKNCYFDVNVTLKEMYNGCVKKITVPLQRTCTRCNGQGTKDKSSTPLCDECKGTGRKTTIYKKGSIIYKDEIICNKCNGSGYFIPDSLKCPLCKGGKTRKENIGYQLEIERGIEDGEVILLKGESNDEPGCERGDLEIVIHELKDDKFTRYDSNLLYKKTLSLTESLAGYNFTIKTLDGRTLQVISNAPVNNGDVICVEGEGMPDSSLSLEKGDLFIEFIVDMPDKVHEEVKNALWKFMPPTHLNDTDNDEANIFTPKFFKSSIFDFKKSKKSKGNRAKNAESISISVTEVSETQEKKPTNQSNGCQPM